MLYRAFLNREGDINGLLTWMDKLYSGASRDSIANQFANSAEFIKLMKNYGF